MMYRSLKFTLLIFAFVLTHFACKSTKTTMENSAAQVEEVEEDLIEKRFRLVIREGYRPEDLVEDYSKGFVKYEDVIRSENLWVFEYLVSEAYGEELFGDLSKDNRLLSTQMLGKNMIIKDGRAYKFEKQKAPVK